VSNSPMQLDKLVGVNVVLTVKRPTRGKMALHGTLEGVDAQGLMIGRNGHLAWYAWAVVESVLSDFTG
jgi:hypothetical protein